MGITLFNIAVAFCGGALGAMFGSLLAFIFIALICAAGIGAAVTGADPNMFILGTMGFGAFSIYAPHISFAGGAFASGYAARRGYIDNGHDITTALISLKKPDVIIMGGLASVVGYLVVAVALATPLAGKMNEVALGVFVVAILGKLIMDGSLFGKETPEVKAAGGRFSVNSPVQWVGYVSSGSEKLLVGLILGFGAAWVTQAMTNEGGALAAVSAYIPYMLSVFTLIGFYIGINIPVTHHIVFCASVGYSFTGSLLWATAFAVTAAFLADFGARCFQLFGNKIGGIHIDPPTMGILFTTILIQAVFPFAYGNATLSIVIPVALLAIAAVLAVVDFMQEKKQVKTAAPAA